MAWPVNATREEAVTAVLASVTVDRLDILVDCLEQILGYGRIGLKLGSHALPELRNAVEDRFSRASKNF